MLTNLGCAPPLKFPKSEYLSIITMQILRAFKISSVFDYLKTQTKMLFFLSGGGDGGLLDHLVMNFLRKEFLSMITIQDVPASKIL